MKRGAASFSKPLNSNMPDDAVATFVPEMLGEIFNRLPVHALLGDLDPRLVCTKWKAVIDQSPALLQRKTKTAALSDCKSKSESLAILRNEKLRGNMALVELLNTAGHNTGIVNQLKSKLNFDDAVFLAEGNEEFAHELFTDGICRVRLACHHESVAHRLLAEKPLERFNKYDIFQLLKQYEFIREQIKQSPALIAKLDGYHIAVLAETDENFALSLLRNPDFYARYNGYNYDYGFVHMLAQLCGPHEQAAHEFLNNFDVSTLNTESIVFLGSYHASVANRILSSSLKDFLSADHKIRIASKHPSLADALFDSPEYRKLVGTNLPILGLIHANVPLFIRFLNDEALKEVLTKVDEDYAQQVCIFASMLNTPPIQAYLRRQDTSVDGLIYEMSKLALTDPAYFSVLSNENIVRIAKTSIAGGLQALSIAVLFDKLNIQDIFNLCEYSAVYAKVIFEKAYNRMPLNNWYQLASKYPAIAKLVKPKLKGPDVTGRLDYALDIAETIQLEVDRQIEEAATTDDTPAMRVMKRRRIRQ